MRGSQAMAGSYPYHARHNARYAEAPGSTDNADLRQAVRSARFRTVLAPGCCALRDAPPAAAFLILEPGQVVTRAAILSAADAVEAAHGAGASALLLADDGAQRDAFKAALITVLEKRQAARNAVIGGRA